MIHDQIHPVGTAMTMEAKEKKKRSRGSMRRNVVAKRSR
jgi:hypothetical protein